MQLGAKLSGQLLIDRVRILGVQQFPEVTLANAERDIVALVGELRHIEAVAAERHQRRIALADFETLEISVLENQERAALVFHHRAVIGDDADALLWIAPVVDENADEQTARLPLTDSDGQVLVQLGEAAR